MSTNEDKHCPLCDQGVPVNKAVIVSVGSGLNIVIKQLAKFEPLPDVIVKSSKPDTKLLGQLMPKQPLTFQNKSIHPALRKHRR